MRMAIRFPRGRSADPGRGAARCGVARASTGLAAGALATVPLVGILALGSLAKIPFVPFTVLEGLGLTNGAAKTAEQVLAVTSLFVAGLVFGLLLFVLVRTADDPRIKRYGLAVGGVLGVFSAVVTFAQDVPVSVTGKIGFVIWVLALFLAWGCGIARVYVAMRFSGRWAHVNAAEKPAAAAAAGFSTRHGSRRASGGPIP